MRLKEDKSLNISLSSLPLEEHTNVKENVVTFLGKSIHSFTTVQHDLSIVQYHPSLTLNWAKNYLMILMMHLIGAVYVVRIYCRQTSYTVSWLLSGPIEIQHSTSDLRLFTNDGSLSKVYFFSGNLKRSTRSKHFVSRLEDWHEIAFRDFFV